VTKEADLEAVAKKHGNGKGKGKQKQADFKGKVCRVGVDVHKAGYAAAIPDDDGQRLEFSTAREMSLPKMCLRQNVFATKCVRDKMCLRQNVFATVAKY
jgi:hypothetical protein